MQALAIGLGVLALIAAGAAVYFDRRARELHEWSELAREDIDNLGARVERYEYELDEARAERDYYRHAARRANDAALDRKLYLENLRAQIEAYTPETDAYREGFEGDA